MADHDRLSCEIADGVADVRLTRADKMNALDLPMMLAIEACGARLAAAPGLRAIVLSGEGRAFCGGLDLDRFRAMASVGGAPTDIVERTHGLGNQAQHIVRMWRDLPVPVIAAVHGIAFGGGFQLMLGADIRIMAPGTRLSVMEVRWGLVPDMAGMAIMRRLARADVIRELTFTGREFTGDEALRLGFATRLADDPHAEALALAREIAGYSPQAMRAAKRLLNLADGGDEAEILLAEAAEQQALLATPNQIEAVDARLARRAPQFSDI